VAGAHSARLLPWIAAERALRGLLLVGVGIFLLVDRNADLGSLATRLARHIELDPDHGLVHRAIVRISATGHHQVALIGALALGYGLLEIVEGVGLWLRKRWAEWLTVVATSLLIPFEIYELVKRPSPLKAAGLVVNILILIYLVRVVRRHER
jgi:uncharacterized membrane protein (DUF2068 family)